MLELSHISKTFHPDTDNRKELFDDFNLQVHVGDCITVIGSNGAGKSTLLQLIAGAYPVDEGDIFLDSENINKMPAHQRARDLGRVFQDPQDGTAANMTIEENLALAYRKRKKRGFARGITSKEKAIFYDLLEPLDLGLETQMKQQVSLLSGGQRQALTLIMATLQTPKLLLLDEHTAALDPKTASKVLEITKSLVETDKITTIMVTHNMADALRMGNRLLMMDGGKIILDVSGEEKQSLSTMDLLERFHEATGGNVADDRLLLAQ